MKIGYKEILEIYITHTTPNGVGGVITDTPYICHVLSNEFGRDINPRTVIRGIGMDVYGTFWGVVKYYHAIFNDRLVLETIYPNLELDIELRGPYDDVTVSQLFNLRERRIAILTKLAEKFPNRRFNVEFF